MRFYAARFATVVVCLALLSVAFLPLLERWRERAQQQERIERLQEAPAGLAATLPVVLPPAEGAQRLAVWSTVGGCGVGGGGASATGGIKWVGRNVTGGLVDVQCLASQTGLLGGGFVSVANVRAATHLGSDWIVAANVPYLIKVEPVTNPDGQDVDAVLPGWGDVSLEVTRKLGVSRSSTLTLSVNLPTGAHQAVRQGVLLPQNAQLGSGQVGATLTYEHTYDRLWGFVNMGWNASYAGGENGVGDYRAPSAAAYSYVGYLMGPFVAAAGLNVSGKFAKDRERFQPLDDAPDVTLAPSVSVEWSSDWLAVLLGFSLPMSVDGVESWTVGLGVSSSVF